MNNYKLIEVICNKYNRADVKRYQKAVVFLIQNTISGEMSLFQIDRIHKRLAYIVASNIWDFKYKMLAKRGLIRKHGEKKMNPVKPKTLKRQGEISKTCRSISHLSIDAEISMMPELLTCLGNANTSDDVLDVIPDDFLYLNDIFC